MSLYSRQKGKLKVMGITVFHTKRANGKIVSRFFGIPVRTAKDKAWELRRETQRRIENGVFDMRDLDAEVAAFSEETATRKDCPPFSVSGSAYKIAFLATELYDTGGHTESMRNLAEALSEYGETKLFLCNLSASEIKAPLRLKLIRRKTPVDGIDFSDDEIDCDIKKLWAQIRDFAPNAIVAFPHSNDLVAACVLSLLKMRTNVKIVYANHSSHSPSLGLGFADAVLEGTESMLETTRKRRKLDTGVVAGLFCRKKEDIPSFGAEQTSAKRKELGIPEGMLCTMSGGAAFKFFDENGDSGYFRMIRRILEKQPHVFHIVLSEFSESQMQTINAVFGDASCRDRLKIMPRSAEYEPVFKCADVFIDSFPFSAALTQVDLMMLKIPAVVKINRENPRLSFHEYMPAGYPYMFDSVEETEAGVLRLLSSPEERKRATDLNYDHYMNVFESRAYGKRMNDLIKGLQHGDTINA